MQRARLEGQVLVVVLGAIHAQAIHTPRHAFARLVEPHLRELDPRAVDAIVNLVVIDHMAGQAATA